ncbi:hypothetical protein OSB04_023936 [Centaurea solstitialis]|uniref:Uncharacterized protein n=1 Tax=Centaurea solstitialis TaxID=347529 RepID=A0AA38SK56_9ASTR|nr:hypothetical protein OSB04_023936 [Centaurea solstitialis]
MPFLMVISLRLSTCISLQATLTVIFVIMSVTCARLSMVLSRHPVPYCKSRTADLKLECVVNKIQNGIQAFLNGIQALSEGIQHLSLVSNTFL